MKKLLFTCLAISVIFTTCKKEEETPTNNTATPYAFSCKINGADFTDNNPVATIIPPNTLEIKASNGSDEVIIYIYNIDDKAEGEEISLASPGNRVYVNLGTDYYSNNISGKLIFSKTGNPVSGTFDDVICRTPQNVSVTVTEGEFVDVAY